MTTLYDGTVVPSYLGVEDRGSNSGFNAQMEDNILRLGEIKRIIYPNDPQSFSGKVLEYEVDVQYGSGGSSYTTSTYRGVSASNAFGGIADQFWSTYRANTTPDDYAESGFGNGAKVLVLCIGGSQQFAVIMGGIKDPSSPAESRSDGHHLFFEFNGLKAEIKDDGELEVTFRGKTDIDGSLNSEAIPEAEGTKIQLNRQGNILLTTPDEAQYVKIDHENHKISILADTEWNVQVNGTTVIYSQDEIHVSTDASVTVTADQEVYVRSAGVHVGDATDSWMLGTTYRNAEGNMNSKLSSAFNNLAIQIATCAINLQAAAGLNSIPVIGGSLAAANFNTAAGILNSVAPILGQMGTAIQTFESGASSYLSSKNLND